MDRSDGMRVLQGAGHQQLRRPIAVVSPEAQGLAGWVLSLLHSWRGQREVRQKQLRLVETLPLGGKRQLMLVTCAGESFLVGGGLESVETIVRLKADLCPDAAGKRVDEPCQ